MCTYVYNCICMKYVCVACVGICVCVCMGMYMYILIVYMYVYTRIYVCKWVYPCVYARVAYWDGYMCECIRCVYVGSPSSLCVSLHVTAFQTRLVRSGPVIGDWSCASCGPNTHAIQRPIHEMIYRSVLVCEVKTRQ